MLHVKAQGVGLSFHAICCRAMYVVCLAVAMLLHGEMVCAASAASGNDLSIEEKPTVLAPLTGDLRAHDPSSILKQGDTYYLFSTGGGISCKSSTDLINWHQEPSVFPRRNPPSWANEVVPNFRGHIWAPDVIKVGDRYLLYYSISSMGKQDSAIGLATNTTLNPADADYLWQDHGPMIRSHKGDPYNAIDPSLLLADDGRLWMAFGSFWQGLHLVEINTETGMRSDPVTKPVQLASADSIEAATLVQRGKFYYLFINHGRCCVGVESTYKILVGRSESPLGPYLDKEGQPLIGGGGTLHLDRDGIRIGPGHVAPIIEEDPAVDRLAGFGFHYYDGDDRGRSKLGLANWEWSADGWPTAVDVRIAEPGHRSSYARRRPTGVRPTTNEQ